MKSFKFAVLFLLYAFNSYAQTFRIDSLPKQGILLDKGWKWHAGDNPDFAKADFDDSAWEETNVSEPMLKGSKILEAEISWFRKTIDIDSSLINKPLIIDLLIIGAAEVYLNGQLIHKLGQVSKDPNIEKTYSTTYNMPYSILFNKSHNVLSIRYSLTQLYVYLPNYFSYSPIDITIKKLDGVTEKILNESWKRMFEFSILIGIFSILMLFHFSFHYFNPKEKVNIFLGFTMLVRTSYFVNKLINFYAITYIKYSYFSIILNDALYLLYYFLLILAIHRYLKKPLTILFGITSIILFLSFLSKFFFTSNLNTLDGCILFAYYVFILSTDVKKGKKEGLLLYYAGILGLIGFIFFTFSRYSKGINIFPTEYLILLNEVGLWIIYLCIPIALSLTLARDFALTSLSLQKEFEENKKLLEEKQQILTTQNETLEKQVVARTAELQHSLDKLKSTQAQLIQSEKLASLGELTAGIAHEIQNPLNFVNNFSELSVELAQELKEEAEKSEIDKELIIELASDLSQNQEKINLHGKRASSIVKGMLEHSRASTGVKELTDINALADEYLRLSYHGLRAKDASFNSDFKTNFDENLPKIEVIPQDVGRVLLNLINNAFYAVQRVSNPLVQISTKIIDIHVIISIKDNGIGMSEATKTKIFQPFFTTKPTGQGTGLGLSLAYDIVTKGHGGTIECESVEGEGTTFIVKLPNLA